MFFSESEMAESGVETRYGLAFELSGRNQWNCIGRCDWGVLMGKRKNRRFGRASIENVVEEQCMLSEFEGVFIIKVSGSKNETNLVSKLHAYKRQEIRRLIDCSKCHAMSDLERMVCRFVEGKQKIVFVCSYCLTVC